MNSFHVECISKMWIYALLNIHDTTLEYSDGGRFFFFFFFFVAPAKQSAT